MGYKFLDQCYDTKQDFLNSVAQHCYSPGSGSGGISSYFTSCIANTDDITVQAYLLSNGTAQTPWTYTPQLISCDFLPPPTLSDSIELAWLVVGVWVVAWGFKKMAEVIRK